MNAVKIFVKIFMKKTASFLTKNRCLRENLHEFFSHEDFTHNLHEDNREDFREEENSEKPDTTRDTGAIFTVNLHEDYHEEIFILHFNTPL